MLNVLKFMAADLAKPVKQIGWYPWATNQHGHSFFVGGLIALAGDIHPGLFCAAALLYLLKELRDLAKGGRTDDSVHDMFFVALGTWMMSSIPALLLAFGLIIHALAALYKAHGNFKDLGETGDGNDRSSLND